MMCNGEPAIDPILEAAAELFERRGFEEVSMEAIADRAGFGRTTVFRRYESKAQVLVAIVDAFFVAFPGFLADRELRADRAETTAERIEHAIVALRAFCGRHGALARVALGARNLPWLRRRLLHEPAQARRLAQYGFGTASASPFLCCLLIEVLRHAAADQAPSPCDEWSMLGSTLGGALAALASGTRSTVEGPPGTGTID